MFDNPVQNTVVITAIVLWFAQGWYFNERLALVHKKLDRIFDEFDGLRDYLYEIDPQFDDERESDEAFRDEKNLFAGADDFELLQRKKQEGRRTLNTPFVR